MRDVSRRRCCFGADSSAGEHVSRMPRRGAQLGSDGLHHVSPHELSDRSARNLPSGGHREAAARQPLRRLARAARDGGARRRRRLHDVPHGARLRLVPQRKGGNAVRCASPGVPDDPHGGCSSVRGQLHRLSLGGDVLHDVPRPRRRDDAARVAAATSSLVPPTGLARRVVREQSRIRGAPRHRGVRFVPHGDGLHHVSCGGQSASARVCVRVRVDARIEPGGVFQVSLRPDGPPVALPLIVQKGQRCELFSHSHSSSPRDLDLPDPLDLRRSRVFRPNHLSMRPLEWILPHVGSVQAKFETDDEIQSLSRCTDSRRDAGRVDGCDSHHRHRCRRGVAVDFQFDPS